MKLLLLSLPFALALSGCYMRVVERSDSPLAQHVGQLAQVRKQVVVFDRGALGRFGVPAGEWLVTKNETVTTTLEPGASFEVIGIFSRRIESGKHYYLVCRYRTAGEDVTFDYPAEGKFIGPDYIIWR